MISLYPLPNDDSSFYPNMSCSWTMFIDYDTSMDFATIDFLYSGYKVFNMIEMTNCKNISLMPHLGTNGEEVVGTQETKICITFNSYGLLGNIVDTKSFAGS
jgi:predicted small integral membrane protein